MHASPITGILLAAGRGVRFDPTGQANKLLQPLADGTPVAVASARTLLAAVPEVIAVVRSDQDEVARCLRAQGCRTVVCPDADQGMGASLVCGVRAAPEGGGYLIALADMPCVRVETLDALVRAIAGGAGIAAPVCEGRRGNPVAFGARHREGLLQLGGDEGARRLLKQHPVCEVAVDDPAIFRDIDQPEDLRRP